MQCLNKTWRHVSVNLEYSCRNNTFKRKWIIRTNLNQGSKWPVHVHVLTDKDHQSFPMSSNKDNQLFEENSYKTNTLTNQTITYLWVPIPFGPRCRVKYTIAKSHCITNIQQEVGVKFIYFQCYYGRQNYNLLATNQRDSFNQLVDNNFQSGTNLGTSLIHHLNNTIMDPNSNNNASNLLPMNRKKTFLEKYKLYIFIFGGTAMIIVLVSAILIITKRNKLKNQDFETRLSINSNIE